MVASGSKWDRTWGVAPFHVVSSATHTGDVEVVLDGNLAELDEFGEPFIRTLACSSTASTHPTPLYSVKDNAESSWYGGSTRWSLTADRTPRVIR